MICTIEGEVMRFGVSQKTKRGFVGLLISGANGMKDVFTVFTAADPGPLKVGEKRKYQVNIFANMGNEVKA